MNTSPKPEAAEKLEVDNKALLDAIDDGFNLDELRTLCFALDIDFDNLAGTGKRGKARELIDYCENRQRLRDLLEQCKVERPGVDWDAFVRAAGAEEPVDENGIRSRRWLVLGVAALAIVIVAAVILWLSGILSPRVTEKTVPVPVPAVSFGESALEVDEGQESAEFTVEVAGSRTETVTVPYETNDVTATAGEDYEATQGVLTFAPGEDSKTIAIAVLRDELDGEESESLQLVLTDLEERPVVATLTIRDLPSTGAGLRVGDVEVDESVGTADVTVELAGGWTRAVTILYETSGRTATAGDDYQDIRGELRFDPGETEKTISVPILLDWLGGEGAETVGLVFRNDPDGDVELPGLPLAATLTIKDRPPPTVSFTEDALAIDESQETAEFTVEFAGSWPEPVSVSYESIGGTATAGDDYEESRGVLTFSSGGDTQTIPISVILDTLAGEGDETIRLVLRNDPNGDSRLPGLPATATLTIKDHPPPTARLALDALEVDEDQGAAEVVVELIGSWPDPVGVPYETGGVTATAGEDYVESQDELIFDPGESRKTITIPITDDSRRELDEMLTLTIGEAPIVIVDDDSSTAALIIKDDGDTESACTLAAEERIAPAAAPLLLGFRAPGLFLRREPSDADDSNIIKVVQEDEVLCVIDSNDGWYRVRLIDAVTDGWIGRELAYTIAPPRLPLSTGTASIPFWDADAEPGCQLGEATGIVGSVREADILRISDRNSDSSCFGIQLTIDGRVGWVQSGSLDTTSAARVEFDNILNSLWLRTAPDGERITDVRQEQILWASASGLDARCDTWYEVRLRHGEEGWLGADRLILTEALQRLPTEINLCEIDTSPENE